MKDELERLRQEVAMLRDENARLRAGRALGKGPGQSEPPREEAGDLEGLMLASATGYAILTTDLEGRIASWNEGARLMFGWEPAEILGRDAEMLFTPEDRAARAPDHEREGALAQGRAEDERWHLRRDGSRFWASGLLMPLREGEGPSRGFLKILRDRTQELHDVRNQLRRLEQMKALAEAARTIVGAPDLPGTLQAITDAARRIVGAQQSVCSIMRGSDWSQAITAVSLSDQCVQWTNYATEPDGSGICAWVCEGNRTVRMAQEELEAHPRWRGFGRHGADRPPLRGWLASALVGVDGRNLGLLQLSDKEDGADFDEVDEAILVQLAQLASSAIERTQAEAQLRASEEQLRLLADALPLLVSFVDREGRYRFTNKAYEAWFGRSRGDILGRTMREVLGDETFEGRRHHIEAALRGEGARFEAVTPRAEDGGRHTEVHYIPRRAADGSWDGFHVVVADMSEQKTAQRALQQAREAAERQATQIEAILGQLAEGVIVTDRTGRIIFVNDAAARIHGVARLDLGPDDYPATYHLFTEDGLPHPPEDLPLTRAALKGETVEDARWLIRRADGREIVAVGGARPIRTPEGIQIGAVLTLRDDTARAKAEAQLLQLNRNLEAEIVQRTAERDQIWQNSNDLMAVFGFDGLRRAINPAWVQVLGHDETTLLTTPFMDLTHPDDRTRLAAAVGRLRQGERIIDFEDRLRHADGSYRTLSWTGVPGEGVFYAIGRDVTEQRLAEEQLRQAQKMEAVGQLTSGLAHDFNNLLAGIVGSLDLLGTRLRQGRTEGFDRYIEAAMTSAQRAAALTHRLLAFSRRQPLDPRPVEVNRLVAGMEDLLRRTLGPATALEMKLADGLWRTLCDSVQLESALLNLCINARDAMPEGGRLTIETDNVRLGRTQAAVLRDVAPGQYVAITVTDTGTGMSPEVMARVFDPFFTTKPIGHGTGLGLSMVYGFAKQSEGHVHIESERGRGATVRIYLPRYAGGDEVADADAPAVEAPRAEGGETVLVVDDEEVVRSLIVEVLGDLGYSAIEAPDGPTGLKLLRSRQRVDLLVTDVGLPGMNGRQLADQAREVRPDLRVLFVTGYAEGAALANGFLEPGMAMLTKPFTIDALMRKLREITAFGDPGG